MLSSTVLLVLEFVTLFSAANAQVVAGKCSGQTCYIASLSGSTVEEYQLQGGKKPKGGNASGDRCIKQVLASKGMKAPAGLKRFQRGAAGLDNDINFDEVEEENTTFHELLASADDKRERGASTNEEKQFDKRQGGCKANTLLFARGTTEAGTMGSTVGPALASPLKKAGWDVQGISYSADLPGIYCIGLKGGMKCVDQLKSLLSRCPNTNVVLSGYSQGAMVARECAAYSTPAVQKKIKGLALFGDPFNGASVKGVAQSRVKTYCNAGDAVCKGEFTIGAAHLAYTGSVKGAAAWIQSVV